MTNITVDLEKLYNIFNGNLTYGTIECTYQQENDTSYYDLYNEKGLACCDGETCEIVELTQDKVLLKNTEGEQEVLFKLSKLEYEKIMNI